MCHNVHWGLGELHALYVDPQADHLLLLLLFLLLKRHLVSLLLNPSLLQKKQKTHAVWILSSSDFCPNWLFWEFQLVNDTS